jgi:hypothetical protein
MFFVSPQFKASFFEKVLFSALNRVVLISFEFTLAGSQSDFVRNHVNIIPTSIEDIFPVVSLNHF